MNNSNYLRHAGLVSLGVVTLLWSACTVYDNSPAPSASVTYVESRPDEDESAYVEIRSEDDFYEPLNSYGHWEDLDGDGRCWIPGRVDREWRPYSSGYWRRTDAGWYWDSDEPWGWATYHYGRWGYNDRFGWYWVPETQWAPSWVSWHQGGGYVGWAPLPPSGRSRHNVSIDVSVGGEPPPRAYVFVQERQFLKPVRPTNVIVNNTTVINQTTNITNIKVVNKTVINEGPRTEVIERATGEKIQAVPARTVRREKEAAVPAPHRTNQPRPDDKNDKRVRPAPNAAPTPVRQARPTPSAAPVAPAASTRESRPNDEPKELPPSAHAAGERQPPPERKPEIEREMKERTPEAQKKSDDESKPRVEKQKPGEEQPRRPASKPQKHVKESPDKAKRGAEKHDAEKHDAEKHAKDKDKDDPDQPDKAASPK